MIKPITLDGQEDKKVVYVVKYQDIILGIWGEREDAILQVRKERSTLTQDQAGKCFYMKLKTNEPIYGGVTPEEL